jgi:Family of unknown function (DUF5372)
LGSLVVRHPFHPLFGERVDVLFVQVCGRRRLYVCDGGRLGNVALPEETTDRAPAPADRPLSVEVLAALVALVAELTCGQGVAR